MSVSVACLATGSDSPVSSAWLTVRPVERSSRTSAGTASPPASWITSPGTSWSVGSSRAIAGTAGAARRSTVVVVAARPRRAAAARPARYSWLTRNPQATDASTATTVTVAGSPLTADTTPTSSSTTTNGSASARARYPRRRGQQHVLPAGGQPPLRLALVQAVQ